MVLAGLLAMCLASTACVKLPGVFGGGDIPAAPGQTLWRSDGYGRIYALRADTLEVYQTTSISCTRGDTFTSVGGPDPDGTRVFGEDGEADGALRIGADGRATYHELGSVSDVDLNPVPSLPAACGEETSEDPVTTFDVFWTTVEENYNSLHRRNVDWAAMRDRYRPMVDSDTSDTQLFGIFRAMLEPLGDMHTGITTAGDEDSEDEDPDDEDSEDEDSDEDSEDEDSDEESDEDSDDEDSDDEELAGAEFEGKRVGTVEIDAQQTDAAVDGFLLAQGATGRLTFGGGKLVYADLPGGRGYLRIDAFEELAGADDQYPMNEAEVRRLLDAVFTPPRLAGLRMLIIDLRNNPGGDDALGLQIAARLTDRPYTAYTKAARNDPRNPDRHARTQAVPVRPADAPRYTGPIRMLTGPLTISAGETFTLAMMGRTPTPERFGENTQGVYSDTMERALPNGWTLTLGNEEFVGPDGRSYEGPGIPPTTPIPVFPAAELAARQDSVMAAALR